VVLVEVVVDVEVVVKTVYVDVAVVVGVATRVVVEVMEVVSGGVVTCPGAKLPMAGGYAHESRIVADAIRSRNTITGAV
jgi:hypothetical protein